MDEQDSTDGQPTVLVVDDEPETADLHRDYLVEDYTVHVAYSGEEAVEIVNSDVSVVLLDRRMAGLSGEEVLTTIRERDIDCRIVMVTAMEPDIDILDLSFDDYLVKPVSRDEINGVVSRMLARHDRDATIQEMFSIVSKMATLEAKMSIRELEASSEYAVLESQFAELRAGTDLGDPADDEYSEFTAEKIQALFG